MRAPGAAVRERPLRTQWRLPATADEVAEILEDARELPRWCPSVFLESSEIERGGQDAVGRRVRLRSRGWLPAVLEWELRVVASRHPHGFTVETRGDLEGRCEWTFEPSGAWTVATSECRLCVRRPLLGLLSRALPFALSANHRWAMRRGEESLRLEIARRRAATPARRARIPPPPPAASMGTALAVGLLVGAAAFAVARWIRVSIRGRRGR
jgi:hypothetical protein